jgi:ATP-binding cassette subfamily B protein
VLSFISAVCLLMAVMVALIVMDPAVALLASVIFGLSYLVIGVSARRALARIGERIASTQGRVIKSVQEGLGGIRDVILDGTQTAYCTIFQDADRPLRRAQATNSFLGQIPRYLMETVGMVLIAVLAFVLTRERGGIQAALPVLGALALGAQRLLPALQQSYSSWTSIVSSHASLRRALDVLEQPIPAEALVQPAAALVVTGEISLRDVCFQYDAGDKWALDHLSLSIPKGTRVGLVGASGSGKSTVIDIMMGLLEPTRGRLMIDGMPIHAANARAWQRAVAHVPQTIFLADASIAENIAFGVTRDEIDMQRVRHAASQAQLLPFVQDLPQGFFTEVGERGARLSGGQRQRIGIARALYKQAKVLILDEATSALDSLTEESLMKALDALGRDFTVVLIAHRLSTVRGCDTIFELDRGHLVAEGSYEYLLENSASFRRMVEVSGS